MSGSLRYSPTAPHREEVDRMPGLTVLEFGTDWCGICTAAQPTIRAGLAAESGLNVLLAGGAARFDHLKIEDGSGRALGRSFRVKLWPTLIFLRDGREVARLVRPSDAASISRALADLGSTV